MQDQPIVISSAVLAALTAASASFLRFAQSLHDAGNQDITQQELDALTAAIQAGREALGKEEK